MRKEVLMLLLSLMWVRGWSQTDTLVMLSGQRVGVKVGEIERTDMEGIQVRLKEWVNIDGRTFDRVSLNGVSAIKFSDGFVMMVEDGEVVPGNLAQAPTLTSRYGRLYAEGAIRLSKEEERSVLGPQLYELGYRPARDRIRTGLGEAVLGAGLVVTGILTDGSWYEQEPDFDGGRIVSYYDRGHIEVGPRAVRDGGFALLCGSVLSVAAGNQMLRNVTAERDRYPFPSRSRNWIRIGVGGMTVLAGAGVAWLGADRMGRHTDWEYFYVKEGSLDRLTRQSGARPSKLGVVRNIGSHQVFMGGEGWTLFGGMMLAVLGATEMQWGVSGLAGEARLRAVGLENLSMSVGGTPDGYGLVVRF